MVPALGLSLKMPFSFRALEESYISLVSLDFSSILVILIFKDCFTMEAKLSCSDTDCVTPCPKKLSIKPEKTLCFLINDI